MKKFPPVFKKIDELIFKGVDQLQSQTQYRQAVEWLEALPDHQIKLINQAISYLVVILPLGLLVFALTYNLGVRSDLSMLREIDQKLDEINKKSKLAGQIGASIVGRTPVASQGDFNNLVRAAMRQRSVDPNKVRIIEFKQDPPKGQLQRSLVSVGFQRFSSKEFGDLLHGLTVANKVKVENVEAVLNPTSSELKGRLDILYFAKIPVSAGEEKKK